MIGVLLIAHEPLATALMHCTRHVFKRVPPQLAALDRTNISVQELTVRAALEGHRDHVYHAAFLDPHTAATLTLWRGTAAQYAAIGTKDSNTVYVVVD